MKKSFKLGLMILFTIALLTTCSSDDEVTNNSADIQTIINTAESGAWIITYFFDSDSDETNNFNGYQFIFGSDGTLTASASITATGTWSVTNSSSSSSSSNDIDFNISFSSPADFQELSDDWDIVSVTSSKIELIDVSGGNGGTDYLTFEKL